MGRGRPQPTPRFPPRGYERPKRWSAVSWWLSSLFLVGVAAWTITLVIGAGDDDPVAASTSPVTIQVFDATTQQPLAGATVSYGGSSSVTDDQGTAGIEVSTQKAIVTVRHDGYLTVYGEVDASMEETQRVALNPASLSGSSDGQQVAVATTEQESIESSTTGTTDQAAVTNDQAPNSGINGVVVDEQGNAIDDAKILANGEVVFTDESGFFELPGAQEGTQLHVWASGYADAFPNATAGSDMTVKLTRQDIKAAYLTGAKLGDEAKISELIDVIDRTELNALVVDLKEYNVYYDTQVQFFRDANSVTVLFDPAALVQRLKEKGIYTIARIVVFNDPVVAQNRPDLALKDVNGDVWLGWNGLPWVDPYYRDLWQPNIDLALEAAAMGFDEVQYDYVRFPSDGDLSTADFAGDYTEESRVSTIVEFLEMTQEQLRPTGVKLGADVFAIVAVYPEDQGIGQRLADFTEVVDYIHPMAYPSHYAEGSIGVDGHPNNFPYETLDITIGLGMVKIPGMELKMRPWIQDFSWGDRTYGPEEVRAQIDATMTNGASGWMHWNADSDVTEGALDPA